MKISKDAFKEAMNSIKEQQEIDSKNSKAFSIILKNDYVTNVDNVLYGSLINLLMELTYDTQTEWIEYFIWELDFGAENYHMPVTGKDGAEIPLRTVDDLWNILEDNYKRADCDKIEE